MLALHVIRANEFVCLDTDEHLDMEASKKALQNLAQACRKRGLDRAMLDLRGLPVLPTPHFTAAQLAELVGTFRDAGFTRRHRLAILYQQDVHGGIRNFTFFSRMRGMQVQAFHDFERAMFWLSEEDPNELQPGVPIPIAKREPKKQPMPLPTRLNRTDISRPTPRIVKRPPLK
jgi:hypothetical protein